MAGKIEYRDISPTLEVRAEGDDAPRLSGLGVPVDSWSPDLGGFRERIARGAFKESIRAQTVAAVYNHNRDLLIGTQRSGTLRLEERADGIHFEASPPDTQWARDMLTSIRRRDIVGNSFAMIVREADWERKGDGLMERTVLSGELIEVGPNTFPAYTSTSVQTRSLADVLAEGLDAVGMPREHILAILDRERRRAAIEV